MRASTMLASVLLLLTGCPGPEPRAAPEPDSLAGDAGTNGGIVTLAPDGAVIVVGEGGVSAGATADAGPLLACQQNEKRCVAGLPQRCDDVGMWHDSEPCAATAPVCNNGVCSRFLLVGGLAGLGPRAASGTLKLAQESLLARPRLCSSSICVTGGITP